MTVGSDVRSVRRTLASDVMSVGSDVISPAIVTALVTRIKLASLVICVVADSLEKNSMSVVMRMLARGCDADVTSVVTLGHVVTSLVKPSELVAAAVGVSSVKEVECE